MKAIARIEVSFAVPMEITAERQTQLLEALQAIADDHQKAHPGRVAWVFGYGHAPPPGFFFDEPHGEWDESVFQVEIAERAE